MLDLKSQRIKSIWGPQISIERLESGHTNTEDFWGGQRQFWNGQRLVADFAEQILVEYNTYVAVGFTCGAANDFEEQLGKNSCF